jgi:hypothetical protein
LKKSLLNTLPSYQNNEKECLNLTLQLQKKFGVSKGVIFKNDNKNEQTYYSFFYKMNTYQ